MAAPAGPARQELAAAVNELAERAGRAIMRIYESGGGVRTKADLSPVTDADEAAEAIILKGLAALTPDFAVVAEESVAVGRVPHLTGAPFWLVDPLDGTREFISRNGEFTVNIALIEDGRPTLGVVHLPARPALYFAVGPGEAFARDHDGGLRPIHARRPAEDGLVAVASRSHMDDATRDYLAGLPVKSLAAAGSSLKFCLLAAGEADLYPRFGRTMEWDTAAGHAVLAAAGGHVRTCEGVELGYGKPGFANPAFIASGGA